MNKNIDIGTKIKKYRKDKKYTLKMLSEQTGLSIGFLSQLERGMTTIAIDSLANVARVLGVELADFFESDTKAGTDPVTHGYDMPMTQIGPEIIQYTLSNNVEDFVLFPRLFYLLPFGEEPESEPEPYKHEGEEFIYVLEGILALELEGKHYTLYPGDSIQFSSKTRHNWKNQTSKITKILMVNTPNPMEKED